MRTGLALAMSARTGDRRCTVSKVCVRGVGSLELFLARPDKTSGGIPDFPLTMPSIIEGPKPATLSPPVPLKLVLASAAGPKDDLPNPSPKPGCSEGPDGAGFAFARNTCGGKDG